MPEADSETTAPGVDLTAEIAGISWYHSIDLGDGIVTPGNPPDEQMLRSGLPEVSGKTVLDIGAWDGFWSFEAERRGASRVVAMDHYAWNLDFAGRLAYWERCEADGVVPDHTLDFTEFWHPDEMPGRAGFDLARRVRASNVEAVQADFTTVDPEMVGRFDVVLFLGVLYHVREPLSALERVLALASRVVVVETEAIAVLGLPDASLLEFHDTGGLRGDYTNWFVPTEAALHALCRAAGFARVVTRIGPPPRSRLLKSGARRLVQNNPVGRKSRGAAEGLIGDRRSRDSSQPTITRYRIAVWAYRD